jgi:hypothetical protein
VSAIQHPRCALIPHDLQIPSPLECGGRRQFPLYQFAWSNNDGHYPWSPNTTKAFKEWQPVLGAAPNPWPPAQRVRCAPGRCGQNVVFCVRNQTLDIDLQ